MSEPLVSIITPTYNHGSFIQQCIQSVLCQTLSDWEMIIVDDASTDNTEEVVRGFADPRITYIRQEHVGPYRMAETYNRALGRARGAFVAILEGDDLWPTYKLALQVSVLRDEADAIASYGRAGMIDDQGRPLGLYARPQIRNARATTADFLLARSGLQPVTVLIRHDVLLSAGGFADHAGFPAVDLPTLLRLSSIGDFHFSDVILGIWRAHDRQVTANYEVVPASRQVILDFYDALPPSERHQFDFPRSVVVHAVRSSLTEHYWQRTLHHLGCRQWPQARKLARCVARNGSPFRRAEAVLAFVCALTHIDPADAMTAMVRTSSGRRIVEHYNYLARDAHPELLIAALQDDLAATPDYATRATGEGAEQ